MISYFSILLPRRPRPWAPGPPGSTRSAIESHRRALAHSSYAVAPRASAHRRLYTCYTLVYVPCNNNIIITIIIIIIIIIIIHCSRAVTSPWWVLGRVLGGMARVPGARRGPWGATVGHLGSQGSS